MIVTTDGAKNQTFDYVIVGECLSFNLAQGPDEAFTQVVA